MIGKVGEVSFTVLKNSALGDENRFTQMVVASNFIR